MDELLFQTDDLMTMEPHLSDGEIVVCIGSWFDQSAHELLALPHPDEIVLLEFVRAIRHMHPVHAALLH